MRSYCKVHATAIRSPRLQVDANQQSDRQLLATGSLRFRWLVATPYAHFADEILLAVPILGLLGRDAQKLSEPVSVVVL